MSDNVEVERRPPLLFLASVRLEYAGDERAGAVSGKGSRPENRELENRELEKGEFERGWGATRGESSGGEDVGSSRGREDAEKRAIEGRVRVGRGTGKWAVWSTAHPRNNGPAAHRCRGQGGGDGKEERGQESSGRGGEVG